MNLAALHLTRHVQLSVVETKPQSVYLEEEEKVGKRQGPAQPQQRKETSHKVDPDQSPCSVFPVSAFGKVGVYLPHPAIKGHPSQVHVRYLGQLGQMEAPFVLPLQVWSLGSLWVGGEGVAYGLSRECHGTTESGTDHGKMVSF